MYSWSGKNILRTALGAVAKLAMGVSLVMCVACADTEKTWDLGALWKEGRLWGKQCAIALYSQDEGKGMNVSLSEIKSMSFDKLELDSVVFLGYMDAHGLRAITGKVKTSPATAAAIEAHIVEIVKQIDEYCGSKGTDVVTGKTTVWTWQEEWGMIQLKCTVQRKRASDTKNSKLLDYELLLKIAPNAADIRPLDQLTDELVYPKDDACRIRSFPIMKVHWSHDNYRRKTRSGESSDSNSRYMRQDSRIISFIISRILSYQSKDRWSEKDYPLTELQQWKWNDMKDPGLDKMLKTLAEKANISVESMVKGGDYPLFNMVRKYNREIKRDSSRLQKEMKQDTEIGDFEAYESSTSLSSVPLPENMYRIQKDGGRVWLTLDRSIWAFISRREAEYLRLDQFVKNNIDAGSPVLWVLAQLPENDGFRYDVPSLRMKVCVIVGYEPGKIMYCECGSNTWSEVKTMESPIAYSFTINAHVLKPKM